MNCEPKKALQVEPDVVRCMSTFIHELESSKSVSNAEAEVSQIAKLLNGITPYQLSLVEKVEYLISEIEHLRQSRLVLINEINDYEVMITRVQMALRSGTSRQL